VRVMRRFSLAGSIARAGDPAIGPAPMASARSAL